MVSSKGNGKDARIVILKMTLLVVPARRKDTLAGGEARIETRE